MKNKFNLAKKFNINVCAEILYFKVFTKNLNSVMYKDIIEKDVFPMCRREV